MRAGIVARLASADLRRRSRHFHLLVALGATTTASWMFYADRMQVALGVDHGYFTSAWTGAALGALAASGAIILGFLYVRSGAADARGGVGRLLAATEVSSAEWVTARFLSNAMVLGALALPFVVAAPAVVAHRGEVPFAAGSFFAAFLPMVVPAVLWASAAAALFDASPRLRGGAGNLLYFALWAASIQAVNAHDEWWADPAGLVMVNRDAQVAAAAQGVAIGNAVNIGGIESPTINVFDWPGFTFDSRFVLTRLTWVVIALLAVAAAALVFDRFDPAASRGGWLDRAIARVGGWLRRRPRPVADAPWEGAGRLSPLGSEAIGGGLLRLTRMAGAELRMLLRPIPWPLFIPLALLNVMAWASRGSGGPGRMLLAMFWLVPVLPWSRLGARIELHRTRALIFSAPGATVLQPLGAWLAGAALALLVSWGIGLAALTKGDIAGVVSWLAGAGFVAALAIACGALAGSDRLFQGLYLLWWLVSVSGNQWLDFMDLRGTHVATAWVLPATAALVAVALARRQLPARVPKLT